MSKFRLQESAPYSYWGVTFPERNVKDGVLDRIRHYTFDPKDILVAGFPKSGELRWSLLRMFSTQGSSINDVILFLGIFTPIMLFYASFNIVGHADPPTSGMTSFMDSRAVPTAQGFWKCCQNTGNLVYLIPKFPDAKDRFV